MFSHLRGFGFSFLAFCFYQIHLSHCGNLFSISWLRVYESRYRMCAYRVFGAGTHAVNEDDDNGGFVLFGYLETCATLDF